MALGKGRLELMRNAEGGYALAAPRAGHRRLEAPGWRARREVCSSVAGIGFGPVTTTPTASRDRPPAREEDRS
jgi:hypothetical protein